MRGTTRKIGRVAADPIFAEHNPRDFILARDNFVNVGMGGIILISNEIGILASRSAAAL